MAVKEGWKLSVFQLQSEEQRQGDQNMKEGEYPDEVWVLCETPITKRLQVVKHKKEYMNGGTAYRYVISRAKKIDLFDPDGKVFDAIARSRGYVHVTDKLPNCPCILKSEKEDKP